MVVSLLTAELQLALRATRSGSALERLRRQLAGREELVGGADVHEEVERALGRGGGGEEVRRVVREPGCRRRAGRGTEVGREGADAPRDDGGVAARRASVAEGRGWTSDGWHGFMPASLALLTTRLTR